MESNTIAILGFLIFGGGFVLSLLRSLMLLMSHEFSKDKKLSGQLIGIFKWPLVFLGLLILFIVFVLPSQ